MPPTLSAYALRLLADKDRGIKPPPAPEREMSPYKKRKSATHYLEAEEQRKIKATMRAEEPRIVAMLMRGTPVTVIAALYHVTDEAIRKRVRSYGIKLPESSVWDARLPIYRHIAQHEILRVEIDNHHPKSKAASRKFDPAQLLLPGVN